MAYNPYRLNVSRLGVVRKHTWKKLQKVNKTQTFIFPALDHVSPTELVLKNQMKAV